MGTPGCPYLRGVYIFMTGYSVVGTWPSAVARVMSGTRIGRWREDLLPRTHIMAERRVAKDSRHLSQPITVEYGFCCFPAIMSASRL